MVTLLEVFAKAKNMDNMGQKKTLICMQAEPFAIFNAEILDPYLNTLIVKDKAVTFTDVQAMNCQADFVD